MDLVIIYFDPCPSDCPSSSPLPPEGVGDNLGKFVEVYIVSTCVGIKKASATKHAPKQLYHTTNGLPSPSQPTSGLSAAE